MNTCVDEFIYLFIFWEKDSNYEAAESFLVVFSLKEIQEIRQMK